MVLYMVLFEYKEGQSPCNLISQETEQYTQVGEDGN